jgi:hypothetical protein
VEEDEQEEEEGKYDDGPPVVWMNGSSRDNNDERGIDSIIARYVGGGVGAHDYPVSRASPTTTRGIYTGHHGANSGTYSNSGDAVNPHIQASQMRTRELLEEFNRSASLSSDVTRQRRMISSAGPRTHSHTHT